MDREHTLEQTLDIRKKMHEGAVGIRWPSNEMLASIFDRPARRHGPGEIHDGYKEYEPGDDLRHVDWIATAASPEEDPPVIKTYFEPRVVRFNVLLDVNPYMNFGTVGTMKNRLAALAAACGIYSAAKMKDRVSYVTFSNEPVTIRKAQGASRILTDFLIHALEDGASQEKAAENPGGGLAAAFRSVRQAQKSMVLVVSSFTDFAEDDWDALRISGFKNDTVAVFVQDLRERELPEVPFPGASYSFEDYRGKTLNLWVTPDNVPSWLSGLTNAIARIGAKLSGAGAITTREQYREKFKAHEQKVLDRLRSYGIKTVVVSTEAETDAVRDLLRVLANKTR